MMTGDIDIDFANRAKALSLLDHTPASIIKNNNIEKHNTGVYFHLVPTDPVTQLSSLDYKKAELNGWYKIDLLNVSVYEDIKNEEHLLKLMETEINWELFTYSEFVSKLIHLNNHADMTIQLKPKSIDDIAMILALIRPGKRHLFEKCKLHGFDSIKDEIWTVDESSGYVFKKAHSYSYAMLVLVHANLLIEQLNTVDEPMLDFKIE